MSIHHQVVSRAPSNDEKDLQTDIVIEWGGLRNATALESRNKAILIDVTYAGPHAVGNICVGGADRDRLAASKYEACKRSHYAGPGQVSFDERSYKLDTFVMESFGRLGKEGSDLIDKVTATIVGGTDGSP